MKRSVVLAFALLIAAIRVISGAAVDAPSAVFDVRFDVEHRRLDGTMELTLVPEQSTVYLSLLANLDREPNPHLSGRSIDAAYPFGFEPSETRILGAALVDGDAKSSVPIRLLALPPAWQTYSLDETVVAIDLPDFAPAKAVTLRIEFVTDVPRQTVGDNGITDSVLTWRFGWAPILFPEQGDIVEENGRVGYAGRDAFPLTFPWMYFDATVTVPDGYDVIAGTDVREDLATDGSEEARFRIAYDGPARSLAIAIGDDYARYVLDGPIPIEVVTLPGHDEDARYFATLARDILAEYEVRYGSYPRERLTIVENPNLNGLSFAADGIVWLSRRFFTHRNVLFVGALNRVAEYVLAHEIAHQWVGLGTGIDLNAEAWLSEGLAQYLAVRYYEDRYGAFEPNLFAFGASGVVEELVEQQFGFFNLREHFIELPYLTTQYAGFDEALIKPIENVRFGNASTVRLYDKGYLVARTIASAIGEEAFEHGILRAVAERRADLLDVRTFQTLLEEESGGSLDAIFDTWVYGAGHVDYSIRIAARETVGAEHVTTVAVTRTGGTVQPVEVEATLQSGATTRQVWAGDAETAELVFRTPSQVARATIDPDHRIPDLDRLNNHDPVRVVSGANEAAYPLDAYVLTADTMTGGITFSYLDRLRIAIAQNAASANVKLGRTHRLSVAAATAENRLLGGIALTTTRYDQPETGSPATFWLPDVSWTVGLKRFLDGETTRTALELDVVDHPSVGSSRTSALSADVTAGGGGRVSIVGSDELRLFPGAYLQGSARIGFGFGDPPEAFRFRLTGLRAFEPSPTDHELVGELALELPIAFDLPYNLINIAMVDALRSRLFLAGGRGWTRLGEFGTTSPYIEAGIEQIFDLSTLGGLLSLNLRVGVATPVMGRGTTAFYVQLSL
jgi:hypothetical protein